MGQAYLFLSYLLFMDLGNGFTYDYAANGCYALKMSNQLSLGNKVMNVTLPSSEDIAKIMHYFADAPYCWVVDAFDVNTAEILQEHGFSPVWVGSGMVFDLAIHTDTDNVDGLVIKEATTDEERTLFVNLVTESFQYAEDEKMEELFHYLVTHVASGALHCYVGLYQNRPVAVGIAIYHADAVSLHKIGTLPAYRNKGIGSAVTHHMLHNAAKRGCTQAILCASPEGKTLYERIGFKQFATYNFYSRED
jgi:ribosomal protein S18 acetylase RimI-like enzyme